MLTNSTLKNFKIFSISKKFMGYGIKSFRISAISENKKTLTNTDSQGQIEIKAPLEQVLASAGTCEIHSIQFFAKKNQVPIEKIDIEVKGDFDMDVFLGEKNGKNTFTNIDVALTIQSSEKDKKKLEETVNKGIEKCPVMNTLHLAGINIKKTVNYV
jgi:uncharacterized OsmC-like protein